MIRTAIYFIALLLLLVITAQLVRIANSVHSWQQTQAASPSTSSLRTLCRFHLEMQDVDAQDLDAAVAQCAATAMELRSHE